jgi:hypothetical protein
MAHASTARADGLGIERRAHLMPALALIVLAPVVSEVLLGSTRLSTIAVLIPQLGTWGCATLLIRDFVRRRRRGWNALLLLGIALAIAEECVIQQTSLAPLVGTNPQQAYGRSLGVNWIYFLWALGYESVWVVLIPIQIAELIFRNHRDQPWLKQRGLIISSLIFLFASFVAWYLWRRIFVPKFFPELVYDVPLTPIVVALAAIGALAAAALMPWPSAGHDVKLAGNAPPSWRVGVIAFGFALPWFGLLFLAYGAWQALPPAIPFVIGLGIAAAAYLWIARISRSSDWGDSSKLALVIGALVASMVAGYPVLILARAPMFDLVGKLIVNAIALVLLARLASRVRRGEGTTGITVPRHRLVEPS